MQFAKSRKRKEPCPCPIKEVTQHTHLTPCQLLLLLSILISKQSLFSLPPPRPCRRRRHAMEFREYIISTRAGRCRCPCTCTRTLAANTTRASSSSLAMDQRRRSRGGGGREFEDFDPVVEWKVAGEEQDVVEISLPGFRKDQVRVQVDNHGVLRATGERPARGGRWARFKKDLRLPENCDADAVRARFEAEKLVITLPIVPPPRAPPSPTPSPEPGTPTPTTSPPPGPPRWPLSVYDKPPQPPKEPPRPSPTPSPEPGTPTPRTSPPRWPLSVHAKPPQPPKEPPRPSPTLPPPPRRPPGYLGPSPPPEPPRPSSPPLQPPPAPPRPSPPPPPPPPLRAEEAPKKPLQDTMAPEEDGRVSRALLRGIVDDAGTASGKNQAPTTVATAMVPPEQGRQLLVNAVAAAAVLVGIVWWAWRNLSS